MKKFITHVLTNSKLQLVKSITSYVWLTCVAFCFMSTLAFAKKTEIAKFEPSSEDRVLLEQVESYLNKIQNLSAKFIQKSTDGNLVEGKFYLARNKNSAGKMRVEYMAQPKVLIVVNGSVLSYLDIELDEVSHIGTNTTPASLLTRPNISFEAKDVVLTGIKKSDGEVKISVMKKNRMEAGEFALVFKTNPLEFIKMEVKNDLEQVVEVKLSDVDFTSSIPDHLFVIKNKNLE